MLGTDAVELEVLCNWFKVDAIAPVPLKGGLKKIPLEESQRGGERKQRKKKTFCVPRGVWRLIMIEQALLSGALLTNMPWIDVGEAPL